MILVQPAIYHNDHGSNDNGDDHLNISWPLLFGGQIAEQQHESVLESRQNHGQRKTMAKRQQDKVHRKEIAVKYQPGTEKLVKRIMKEEGEEGGVDG